MALAKERLKLILPERLAEFYGQTPVAEVRDKERIQQLVEQKGVLDKELEDLERCLENLSSWITVCACRNPCT